MLECNRAMKKRRKLIFHVLALTIPLICLVILLSQTAFAQNTYLINDGGKVWMYNSYATDPAAVLNEAGLKLGQDDQIVTSATGGMSQITVQRKQTVTVILGDRSVTAVTYGETVDSLLRRLDISLARADQISVPVGEKTCDGMQIVITRATRIEESYLREIPFETEYCYDPALPEGVEQTLTQGVMEQLLCTDDVYYVAGEEVARVSVSEIVLRQGTNALVAVGIGK